MVRRPFVRPCFYRRQQWPAPCRRWCRRSGLDVHRKPVVTDGLSAVMGPIAAMETLSSRRCSSVSSAASSMVRKLETVEEEVKVIISTVPDSSWIAQLLLSSLGRDVLVGGGDGHACPCIGEGSRAGSQLAFKARGQENAGSLDLGFHQGCGQSLAGEFFRDEIGAYAILQQLFPGCPAHHRHLGGRELGGCPYPGAYSRLKK